MNFSQKAKKAVAAGLALSTMMWSVSLFAVPAAVAAPHNDGCLVNVSGTVYLIQGGQKRGFTSAEVFMSHGYNFGQVVTANAEDAALPTGSILIYADGTLVKGPADPLVYLVVNGQKRGFTSGSVFTGLGYSFANIQWAPVNTFNDIPTGANIDSTAITGLPMSGPGPKTVTCTTTGTPGLTGEGSVDTITLGSAEDTEISEGQEDVELVEFDVKLTNDGSLRLDRFDLYMGNDHTVNTDSTKPWDYFTEVSLMVNGSRVQSMDVDSSSDWTKYTGNTLTTTNQEYRLRFSGLNAVLPSGETSNVTVAFSAHSNMDSADEVAEWQYGSLTDSFRFEDATGFVFTDGVDDEDEFTWGTSDTAALKISASDEDPDASVIRVDRDDDTNGVEIGVFEIEETNGLDVNITEMTVTLATSDTITDVARRLHLVVDGQTYSETVTGLTVTFDNLDIDVDADDMVTVSVEADLDDTNDNVRYQNGDTLQVASVNLTEYTDEADNDDGDFTETGSYAGKVHGLYSEGIEVEVNSATTTVTDDGSGATFVSGVEFKWNIDITAFGDEVVYVNKDIADIVASSTAGDVDMLYTVEESTGAAITGLSGTVASSATSVTGDAGAYSAAYNGETFYKITPGQTITVEITVTGVNQTDTKQVRATLDDIEWTTDFVDVDVTYDGSTATINSHTFGLGEDAATPFRAIN
jgi:hypothetical protein